MLAGIWLANVKTYQITLHYLARVEQGQTFILLDFQHLYPWSVYGVGPWKWMGGLYVSALPHITCLNNCTSRARVLIMEMGTTWFTSYMFAVLYIVAKNKFQLLHCEDLILLTLITANWNPSFWLLVSWNIKHRDIMWHQLWLQEFMMVLYLPFHIESDNQSTKTKAVSCCRVSLDILFF